MKRTRETLTMPKTLLFWLAGLLFSMLATASVTWAQETKGMLEDSISDGVVVGSFDGVDLKVRRIWISDMVYILDRSVKVKGTSTKLGLLTDLKMGETVQVTLLPNEETPSIPFVVLIERL